MILQLADEAATLKLGQQLGRAWQSYLETPPREGSAMTVGLNGPLGAGKTTLVRGLLNALGHEGAVPSPTFALAEFYSLSAGNCWHLDLYRLDAASELHGLGFDEMSESAGDIMLIEWPKPWLQSVLELDALIELSYSGDGRQARLQAFSDRAQSWLVKADIADDVPTQEDEVS